MDERELEDLCRPHGDSINIENGLCQEREADTDFVLVWKEKPSDPDWATNKYVQMYSEQYSTNTVQNSTI